MFSYRLTRIMLACALLCIVTFNGNLAFTSVPLVRACNTCDFLLAWGSLGSGDGQFNAPWGVAVDSSGNVYVTDPGNNRVEKFTGTGIYLTQWGSNGAGNGQFGLNGPGGVAVDSSGNVYVTDPSNYLVQKFDSSGIYLTQWGSNGAGNGQFAFIGPWGVAVDSSGNVYVTDPGNNRVEKFTGTGTYLTQWGSFGSGDGQFNEPFKVAVDSSGNVYVTDVNNYRVEKFDSSGNFLLKWGSFGSGDGQFGGIGPYGVAVDSSGNVYVLDPPNNNRVEKFTGTGTYLTQWSTNSAGNVPTTFPSDVAVDSAGNVYVTDSGNNRVEKFGDPGFTLSFDASGLLSDVDSSTVVLTVTIGNAPATSVTKAQLPKSFSSIAPGTTVSYSYNSPLASTTAGKQYRWLSTSGTGSASSQTGQSGSFTLNLASTVTATYKTQYQLTISVSPSGSGTAIPVPAGSWYDSGTSVSVTATPATGYVFGSWLQDSSPAGSANPVAVTMNAPHNLVAQFLSPKTIKSNVLAELQALRATVTDKQDQQKLDDAISYLTKSLDPSLWVSDTRLDPKHGDKVFQDEKDAVVKLLDLLKNKKSTIADATLQGFINRIVSADRLLASTAVSDAVAASGNPNKISQANDELSKGDGTTASGDFTSAIEHYRNAWQHAQEAMTH